MYHLSPMRAARNALARWMEYPEDLIPVGLILVIVSVQLGLYLSPWSTWTVAVIVLLVLPVQQVSRAILHFHHHRNVFRVAALNRIYEVLLFLCTGLSPQQFTLHHVLGHHVTYFDHVHDALRWKRPDGARMSVPEFLLTGTLGLYRVPFQNGPRYPRIFRRFKVWLVVCLALLAALIAYDPLRALVVYVGPMLILMVDIIRLNLWDHVGVEGQDHLTASRNTLSTFYNVVTFNSGYHTAHHIDPSMHWSRVPELHAKIAPQIPPELNEGEQRFVTWWPPRW